MSGELLQTNDQLLSDISNLQQIEQSIYSQLQAGQYTLSDGDKQSLINKINQVSQMRINLYKSLGKMNSFYSKNLANNSATLDEQTKATRIIEREMNEAKTRMNYINGQKINKMRQVQINNYYSSWYEERTTLLKYVIILIIGFIILYYLKKINILSENIYGGLIVLFSLIMIYFIIPVILSMLSRDNINYSEYDWAFDKNSAPKLAGNANASSNNPWSAPSVTTTCVGESCCPEGVAFDSTLNQCVVPNTSITTGSTGSSNSTTTNVSLSSSIGSLFDGANSQFSSILRGN